MAMDQLELPRRGLPGLFSRDTATVNGTRSFPSILEAIEAADDGDLVTAGAGSYLETLSGFPTGLSLIGPGGRGATIDGEDEGVALDVDADDVTVAGFEIATDPASSHDAVNVSDGVDWVTLRDLIIPDAGGNALDHLAGSSVGTRATDIVVEGSGSDAIVWRGQETRLEATVSAQGAHGPISGTGVRILAGSDHDVDARVLNPDDSGLTDTSDRARIKAHVEDAGMAGLNLDGTDTVVPEGTIRNSGGNDISAGDSTGVKIGDAVTYQTIVAGTRTMIGGRYADGGEPTVTLTADQELTATELGAVATDHLTVYHLLVDAGGAAREVQGIQAIAETGVMAVLERSSDENVTLAHQDGGATNPLSNLGGGDVTLDADGDCAAYQFTNSQWDMLWQDT